MSTVHPNLADPNAFEGFDVRIGYSAGRRRVLPCVTGGLLQPTYLIWIVPERRYFSVRIFTDHLTPEQIVDVERIARSLPGGGWSSIRHWHDVSLPDRIRYSQTRGHLVDFDFDRLELEIALDNAHGTDMTVTELIDQLATQKGMSS